MTQLVHQDHENHTFWENVTSWFDTVLFGEHHNHRAMMQLSDDIELVETELYEFDKYLGRQLTPVEEVALFALNLRYRDLHHTMERKWSDERVKRSALRALEGIHLKFLGPIPENRRHLVAYATGRTARSIDVMGFIESHRIERDGIWTRGLMDVSCSITAVTAPLWTWDVLDAMTQQPHVRREGNEAMRWYYSGRHNEGRDPFRLWVGEPAPIRTEHADEILSLWEPTDESSPFRDIPATIEALARL